MTPISVFSKLNKQINTPAVFTHYTKFSHSGCSGEGKNSNLPTEFIPSALRPESHPASTIILTGEYFPRVKQQENETDNSPRPRSGLCEGLPLTTVILGVKVMGTCSY